MYSFTFSQLTPWEQPDSKDSLISHAFSPPSSAVAKCNALQKHLDFNLGDQALATEKPYGAYYGLTWAFLCMFNGVL